ANRGTINRNSADTPCLPCLNREPLQLRSEPAERVHPHHPAGCHDHGRVSADPTGLHGRDGGFVLPCASDNALTLKEFPWIGATRPSAATRIPSCSSPSVIPVPRSLRSPRRRSSATAAP